MLALKLMPAIAAAALMAAGLPACADNTDAPAAQSRPAASTPSQASNPGSTPAATADGCYVHLFDSDNFKESDDHYRLTQPGRYADLDNLPGATKNWTDEADSIKVGPAATVTIWSATGFGGSSMQLDPGSQHPDLDSEPYSLEMTCSN